jgi:hypothetical protein
MSIPQIQIRQQYALIGIDTQPGRLQIQQPQATMEIRQTPAELRISQPMGHFEINQDRARDALGIGNHLETMQKIYSKASDIALEGVARVVEEGNQLAAIHLKGNPIADNAANWQSTSPDFDVRGPASFDNVDIQYIPGQLSMDASPARVDINVQVNPPVISYQRGTVDIYLRQKPDLQIIPPQIDIRM